MPTTIVAWSKGILRPLASILLLAACSPALADPVLSVEGLNKNSVVKVGGLYLTRSEVLTEGGSTKVELGRKFICSDNRVSLLVDEDFEQYKAEEICRAANSALDFSVKQSGGQRVSVEIRVVPPRVSYSSRPWRVGRFPKLVLVVPDMAELNATLANVSDLVAHEVFHVVMLAAGDKELAGDEYVAYRFGLCGQLVGTGQISRSAIPGFSLRSSDPNIVSSSSAAERVRAELVARSEDEPITVDAPFGQELLEKCRSIKPNARGDFSAQR